MLSLKCSDCGNGYTATLECRIGADGIARFYVMCPICGNATQQFDCRPITLAIEQMLLRQGHDAYANVLNRSKRTKKGGDPKPAA